MSRVFTLNPCLSETGYCSDNPELYALPGNLAVGRPPSIVDVGALTTDGYGNFYYCGYSPYPEHHSIIRRMTPGELYDQHFYDSFDCCATLVPFKDLVRNRRDELGRPATQCGLGGELRIRLTYDPDEPCVDDPDRCPTLEPDDQSRVETQILFGQAPRLTALWHDTATNTDAVETVKWRVQGDYPTGVGSDGLYPEKTAVLFHEGDYSLTRSSLQFQTVHTGRVVLKATTTNSQHKAPDGRSPANIEVDLTIETPAKLDGKVNPYDGKILYYSNKYGIPPQYIKSQVDRESAHTFDASSYRYELKSIDIDTLSYWDSEDWSFLGRFRYRFPPDSATLLTADDVRPRNEYMWTTYDPQQDAGGYWPYRCSNDSTGNLPGKLWEIYKANDGWQENQWPLLHYRSRGYTTAVGPCPYQRYNWMKEGYVYMSWHANNFYCSPGPPFYNWCGPKETYYQTWLLNHLEYDAQTAVGASYGLMQVLYDTAITEMRWNRQSGPEQRHPAQLFDPDTSLDLGVGYDAKNFRKTSYGPNEYHDIQTFKTAISDGLGRYDLRKSNCGPEVTANAILFKPVQGGTP